MIKNKKITWLLYFATVGLHSLMWLILYHAIRVNEVFYWLGFVISFLLSFIIFSLTIIVSRDNYRLYAMSSLTTVLTIVFGLNWLIEALAVWILMTLLVLFAVKRIKINQADRIHISVFRSLIVGMPIIGTAMSILIASSFYFSVISFQEIGKPPDIKLNVSKKTVMRGLKTMNFLMPKEELSWVIDEMTVDQYTEKTVEIQDRLNEKFFDEELRSRYQELWEVKENQDGFSNSLEDQRNLRKELSKKALSEQVGKELLGNESMADVMHKLINKKLDSIFTIEVVMTQILPFGIALAMFAMTRSILWILKWPLFWTVSLLFSILVKLKIIKIEKKRVEVDIIA